MRGARFSADPDSQSRHIVGAEAVKDRFQSVMTSAAASRANAYPAERQVQVVAYYHYVLRINALPVHCFPDGPSAFVYIRCRLHQKRFHVGDSAFRCFGAKALSPRADPVHLRQVIKRHEAYIMSCPSIFPARVADADYDFHG